VNVDMIVQSVRTAGQESDLTFTVPTASLAQSRTVLEEIRQSVGFDEILTDTNVVKVSVVGVGMRSNAGIAAQMFEALAARNINILAITTSEIKVSVLIAEEYTNWPCGCFIPPTASTRRSKRDQRSDPGREQDGVRPRRWA
jgi:aspartate kinase